MATFLIALDQATQTTGFSIWRGRQLIAHGHKTFSDNDYMVRTSKLRKWVEELIESVGGDLEIAIEDIQLQDMKGSKEIGYQTFKKLAHVQGALMSLFVEKKIPYYVVLASSWKHTCDIKGRIREEQKANSRAFVKRTFGFDATEDEADAINIGWHILETNTSRVGTLDWS